MGWYRSPSFWASPTKTAEAEDALSALAVGVGGSVLAIGGAANAYVNDRRGRTCDACGSVVKGVIDLAGLDKTWKANRVGKWKTLRSATYSSEGRRERTLRCHKCGAFSKKVQVIPRLVDTSSSDGGGYSDGGGGGGGDF